jgi:tRNA nucleotidyltransferase (CCA-adding enzyme)
MLKIFEFLKAKFQRYGFEVLHSDWEWDKRSDAVLFFLFDNEPLPKNVEVEGPPIKIRQHVENFRKMHKKTFVKSGRVFTLMERPFLLPEELLKELIKDEFVKERCKAIKIEIIYNP